MTPEATLAVSPSRLFLPNVPNFMDKLRKLELSVRGRAVLTTRDFLSVSVVLSRRRERDLERREYERNGEGEGGGRM